MLAQPSGSWKLRAMSVPFCSVHTISVSTRVSPRRSGAQCGVSVAYLAVFGSRHLWICVSRAAAGSGRLRIGRLFSLLRPVVAQVSRAPCDDRVPCCHRSQNATSTQRWYRETYTQDLAPAKTRAAVEPIIVLEFVDLDALAIVGRRRHQSHSKSGGLCALRPASRVTRAVAIPGAGAVRAGDWRGARE